jgi:OmcA/MtrC family decaheme c-type cytochrome
MRTWRYGVAVGAVLATLLISGASCGDDDDDGGAAAPPQVDPDPLNLEIQSVTIPEGTNPRPVVRFRVTDAAGAPVDLATELANWNLGVPTAANRVKPHTVPRFTLSQLEDDGDYLSLYSATVAALAYTPQPGTVPPAAAATQATSQPPSRVAGVNVTFPATDLVPVGAGTGVYDFTMPATTAATVDRTKTHTAAGWIVRTTSSDSDVAYDSYNFVPAGGAAAQLDEVVSDGACNRCHGTLQAHGSRRGTQLCITCHSPQTVDPETSRTVDFKVMIHKIHMGSGLPSVQQETPTNYFIVGNSQNVHDYSELSFPWHDHGVAHCTVCHTGGEDSDNWRSRPNLAACTSCHDNVKFDGSAGTTPCSRPAGDPTPASANCNHSGGLITPANTSDSASCVACHGLNAPNAVDRYHHGD